MSVRNPYKKKKKTHIDTKLMEKIGWSEEDIISFVKDVEEEEKVEAKNENQKVGRNKRRMFLVRLVWVQHPLKSRLLLLKPSHSHLPQTKSHPNRRHE